MSQRPDPADLFRFWTDQWRRAFAPEPAAAPTPAWAPLFDRFLIAQSTAAELAELSLKAWSDLLPKARAGQDWAGSLEDYAARVREAVLGPARSLDMGGDVETVWRRYLEFLERLGRPVADGLRGAASAVREGEAMDVRRLTELFWDAYDATVAPALGAPALGPARGLTDKLTQAFQAWTEMNRAAVEYYTIMADTWGRAVERFLHELLTRAQRDEAPTSQRDLITLFMKIAEAVFAEAYLTPEFVAAQGRAGNTTMSYLRQERELVDLLYKAGHFPTRTEVDAAHEQIHELRKEVRALRKELRRLQTAGDVGVAPSEDSP